METSKKLYFYPVWLRIWHGLNAMGIITLIITGISMQASLKSSIIGFNNAVSIHNFAGVVVTINYFVFFFGNMFTGNGKFYLIKIKGFLRRPLKQAYYYSWGMFHDMQTPYPLSERRKFNPLQKYTYVFTMYMVVPLVFITGISLLFPEIIVEKISVYSGISITAILHSALGFLISIFLVVHLYIASIGKSPKENFKSIITGWHHIDH
jgi:thiosulfate reductase cytochrome b subunit